MTVCSFFLQGRCRYGEKCWNEHPRGGGGGGGGFQNNSYNRSAPQQQPRQGTGGFGNRVWVNPSQQKGGFIQPSSFSHGGHDWAKGAGGGRREDARASDFSFTSQNRFSSLASANTFDRGGRGSRQPVAAGDEDDGQKSLRENIQADVETWERSGQWVFSCYSNLRAPISGLYSPHKRSGSEYYSSRASGDLQSYMNGTNQLLTKWRNRIQELKLMSPSTRVALLAELNNPAPQVSTGGFGSTPAVGFGFSKSSSESKGKASTFSFASGNSGFGSSSGFGQAPGVAAQPASGFGSSSVFGSGFGSSSGAPSAASASSFSFSTPTSNTPASASAFGSAAGFSFSTNGAGSGGSGFGAKESAAAGSGGLFGKTATGFGTSSASPAASGTSEALFSLESKLTPEELDQFRSKRFTLGQIPSKPPPSNLLVL
uniref:Nucleoporin NUP42 n=1 Tax=Tetraodon nigroviridis TaxID=99883 RepID=H3BWI7_TETNG